MQTLQSIRTWRDVSCREVTLETHPKLITSRNALRVADANFCCKLFDALHVGVDMVLTESGFGRVCTARDTLQGISQRVGIPWYVV